jgi:RNA-directed DNA polymerase
MSLPTSTSTVRKLQRSLYVKAKSEPSYRFYSLWDKICREEVLWEAYVQCRRNGGAAGVDRETFEQIEAQGVKRWLGNLGQELRARNDIT